MNNFATPSFSKKSERLVQGVLIFLLVVFSVLAIRYQFFLLRHIEWGDESETIVTARMMAAGQKLYSEIFNHHGPLVFLPGVVLEHFGSFGVAAHRIFVALLQLAALLTIYFSPLFAARNVKLACMLFAATVMLFYFPELLAHTYTYQSVTGVLLFIILLLYTFPAIIRPDTATPRRAFAGSFLIAALPFLAVTYIPLAAILFVISIQKRLLKPAFAGAAFGVIANLLFLILWGSIPGYLAFHFYLNSAILPFYMGSPDFLQLALIAFNALTQSIGLYICLALTTIGIGILASHEKGFPWRSVLLALAMGSLLIRGADFHGLPYYYALISFTMLLGMYARPLGPQVKVIGIFVLSICIAKASLLLPGERQYFSSRRIPKETEFSRLAKKFTNENDKIIAYSFQNFEYIAADRLPASGYFFYLPWQEKYNQAPQYGIRINACQQIADYRPKVMLIDKWNVWDRYPWDSYAGCIQSLIDEHYTQVLGRPYYLRNDIYTADALSP